MPLKKVPNLRVNECGSIYESGLGFRKWGQQYIKEYRNVICLQSVMQFGGSRGHFEGVECSGFQL